MSIRPAKTQAWAGPLTPADAVLRARALVPALRARAKQADIERTVPAQSLAEIAAAGLFRITAPIMFGGSQLGVAALVETTTEIASGCGSTGWLFGVFAGHNWMLSLFPLEAQRAVFDDPLALVASVVRLGGKPPQRVPGGYRFEDAAGKYCSGVDHAHWILVGAGVEVPGGAPESRYFLIPKAEVEVIDDWFTSGLRGTGSRSLRIAKAFVPEHMSVSIADMARGAAPGTLLHDAALYRAPFPQVLPFPLAGAPLGIARAGLTVFMENAGAKLRNLGEDQVGEQSALFFRLAEIHADIDVASRLVLRDAAEIDCCPDGSTISVSDRARFIWDIAYAAHKCRMAVSSLFESSGGSAIYDTFELQRIWRDVNAAAAHNSFVRERGGAAFGRALLGLAPSRVERIGH